jgi:hypothetical protein
MSGLAVRQTTTATAQQTKASSETIEASERGRQKGREQKQSNSIKDHKV